MSVFVTAYVGLGSNLDDPVQQLKRACAELQFLPQATLQRCSRFYASKPFGPVAQPDFVNAVAELRTTLTPEELLRALQRIELQHGRDRSGPRWGPRSLDLDILLYGDERIELSILQVPHPGISQRNFVAYPLAELAKDLYVPGVGKLSALCARLSTDGLIALDV